MTAAPEKPVRDLRVDLVRGLTLLVIFSDHVIGNPLRDFMPISLGFSDMGEAFIFLSGYLNGVRRAAPQNVKPFRVELRRACRRCAAIYLAMIISQGLALALTEDLVVLGMSATPVALWSMLTSDPWVVAWNFLALRWIVWTYAVLALYLFLIGGVPFAAAVLRRSVLVGVASSAAVYAAVQVWPQSVALPQPWAGAFYFNPYAWQFLFVLGMACGIDGARCKACIRRGIVPLVVALCGLEAAFLTKTGWFPDIEVLSWFAASVDKVTLGALRLAHFYCVLVVGRTVMQEWPSARAAAHSSLQRVGAIVVGLLIGCGRNPLPTYCVGGLLAILGTWLFGRYGAGWQATLVVNAGGWIASIVTAYAAQVVWKR